MKNHLLTSISQTHISFHDTASKWRYLKAPENFQVSDG